jgi:hypothetical protein
MSYYIQDLDTALVEALHLSIGSWVVGTAARRTHHQRTPRHLQHLLNNIVGTESKESVSTHMVGTPQVLGPYDM